MAADVRVWHCEGCGETFDADPGMGHGRAEHDPHCNGTCRACPIEVLCGPIRLVSEPVSRVNLRVIEHDHIPFKCIDAADGTPSPEPLVHMRAHERDAMVRALRIALAALRLIKRGKDVSRYDADDALRQIGELVTDEPEDR